MAKVTTLAKDWEVAGVSLAGAVEALLLLEIPQKLGIAPSDIPHYMVLAFTVVAIVRKILAARAETQGEVDGDS